MYDGYAWLSNNVGPTTLSTQLPMLVGIAAALVVVVVVAVVTRRQPPAAASARTRADLRREDARA